MDWFISCTCSCIVSDLKEIRRIGLVYFLYLFLHCFRLKEMLWIGLVYFLYLFLYCYRFEGDAEDWTGLFPLPVLLLRAGVHIDVPHTQSIPL